MATWRIVKEEYVRKRPQWMVCFLVKLCPEVYQTKETLEEARAGLLGISQLVQDLNILERKRRTLMEQDDDSITLTSGMHRPFIRFFIKQDNQ